MFLHETFDFLLTAYILHILLYVYILTLCTLSLCFVCHTYGNYNSDNNYGRRKEYNYAQSILKYWSWQVHNMNNYTDIYLL